MHAVTLSLSPFQILPLVWGVGISLDGDGGFSIRQLGRHLLFKPVTVQALWTVIQSLHMVAERLRPRTGGDADGGQEWAAVYRVTSPQSCINEWHVMADLTVRRPPSPDRAMATADAEGAIKTTLRQIMKTVNLDTITSKVIRKRLENEMGESLENYKSFIDEEILIILGQMDPASAILDYLFLGSEWNASNLDELRQNGITHILNVTREIDNFFPANFVYLNIREYDVESTDLLKHLDCTYKFIKSAKEQGGRVLIHCKMGISRSATVTVSFLMKEYNSGLEETLQMVKQKRSVVKPNKAFMKQLEVYEGILGAIRHRNAYADGLYRSKSESSLVPPGAEGEENDAGTKKAKPGLLLDSLIHVDIKALTTVFNRPNSEPLDVRPKSWSPNEQLAQMLLADDRTNQTNNCNCTVNGSSSGAAPQPQPASTGGNNFLLPTTATSSLPVNSTLYNPDCQCDMELELCVPEEAVVVSEPAGSVNSEADAVVQSISNLRLQSGPNDFRRQSSEEDYNSSPIILDRDELSVRTLANMYDFRSNPAAAPRTCSAAKLEDSQLFQKAAKKLTEQPQSDC